MPAKLARGVISLNQKYVCLSCRLQNLSLAGGRTTRYQHTGPTENDGADKTQDPNPNDVRKYDEAASGSRIGDIIRSFMFKSDPNDKENKGDSRIEPLGKSKVHVAD